MDSNSILSIVLYIIATVSFPANYAQGSTNSDSPCPYGYFYNNTRTTVHPTTTESSTATQANDSTTLVTSPPSIHPSEGTTIDPGCYPCESHMSNCTGCHYSDGNFTCTNCSTSSPGAQINYESCTQESTTSTTIPPPPPFPIWAIVVIVVVPVVIIIAIIVVCIRRRKNTALPLMPDFSQQSQRSLKPPTSGSGTEIQRYVEEPVQSSLKRIPSVDYDHLKKQNADNPVYDDRIDDPSSAIYGNDDASAIYGNDDVIQKHRNVKEPDVTGDEIYTNEDAGDGSTEELYTANEGARREVGKGIDNTANDGGYMNKEEFDRAKKQAEIAREAAARSAAKSAQKSRPINTGPSDRGANAEAKKKKPKNNRNPVEYRPRVNEPTVQGARDSMFPPGQDGGDQVYGNQEEFAKPRTPAIREDDDGQIYANT